jgi:hypothetical protein
MSHFFNRLFYSMSGKRIKNGKNLSDHIQFNTHLVHGINVSRTNFSIYLLSMFLKENYCVSTMERMRTNGPA